MKVTLGASKGTVVIDFATVADLNRILQELGRARLPVASIASRR